MGSGLTRRQALSGCGSSLALAACHRMAGPVPEQLVSIVRAQAYGPALYDTVLRLLVEHKVDARGKKITLKPNLVEFDDARAINTHPLLVHAVLEAFRALGASDVRIAEGPGHRHDPWELAERAGYFGIVPQFENHFTDLNWDEITRVKLTRPFSKLDSLYLPNTALGCDLLVSLPKMKTHHWVGATLSMKNLFGVVPGGVYGWPKNVLHWSGINECIADLYHVFPKHFCIVDGIEAMEGNGPIQGTSKAAGVLVAGNDMVAVDATCCRVMSIDPNRIQYLQLAAGPERLSEQHIHQIGEPIHATQTRFELIPEFQSIRL